MQQGEKSIPTEDMRHSDLSKLLAGTQMTDVKMLKMDLTL